MTQSAVLDASQLDKRLSDDGRLHLEADRSIRLPATVSLVLTARDLMAAGLRSIGFVVLVVVTGLFR